MTAKKHDTPAPTKNEALLAWVNRMVALYKPDRIV
jgi:GTP-dependent phosphoenolpyruvate carboxykinase